MVRFFLVVLNYWFVLVLRFGGGGIKEIIVVNGEGGKRGRG